MSQDHALSDQMLPEQPAPEATEPEDDFDANEYVRDLIARMGGDEGKSLATPMHDPADVPTAAPRPTEPIPQPPTISASETDREPALSSVPESTPGIPLTPTPTEPTRRRPAPEMLSDLERLREAANLTTSNALRTFDCKSLMLSSYTSLATAAVTIGLCLVLMSLSQRPFSVAYWAGVVMFLFAAVATRRFVVSTGILWRHTRNRDKSDGRDSVVAS